MNAALDALMLDAQTKGEVSIIVLLVGIGLSFKIGE